MPFWFVHVVGRLVTLLSHFPVLSLRCATTFSRTVRGILTANVLRHLFARTRGNGPPVQGLSVIAVIIAAAGSALVAQDIVLQPKADVKVTSQLLEVALDQPIGDVTSNWNADEAVPLQELLDVFASSLSESAGYGIRFVPDTDELELDGIAALDEVTVHVPPFAAGTVTYRDALTLALDETADPELAYCVRGGRILISTRTGIDLDEALELRVYDVNGLVPVVPRDLVIKLFREAVERRIRLGQLLDDRSVRPRVSKAGTVKPLSAETFRKGVSQAQAVLPTPLVIVDQGWFEQAQLALAQMVARKEQQQATQIQLEKLRQMPEAIPHERAFLALIIDQTSPPLRWYWIDGEGGKITMSGGQMFVTQSYSGHRMISELLHRLALDVAENGVPVTEAAAAFESGLGFQNNRGSGMYSVDADGRIK
jgi:hypothetical protein